MGRSKNGAENSLRRDASSKSASVISAWFKGNAGLRAWTQTKTFNEATLKEIFSAGLGLFAIMRCRPAILTFNYNPAS